MSPDKVESLERRYEFFRPSSAVKCKDGWYKLIDELCGLLANYDLKGAKIDSLEEKYGGLHVGLSFNHEELEGDVAEIINCIETKSFMICEECGSKGQLKEKHGVYKTLCDICRLILTP